LTMRSISSHAVVFEVRSCPANQTAMQWLNMRSAEWGEQNGSTGHLCTHQSGQLLFLFLEHFGVRGDLLLLHECGKQRVIVMNELRLRVAFLSLLLLNITALKKELTLARLY
jgi:hypothetical protein